MSEANTARDEALEWLNAAPPGMVYTLAELPLIQEAAQLARDGGVITFAWEPGGRSLAASIRHPGGPLTAWVTPGEEGIELDCQCPAAQSGGPVCAHGLAALMACFRALRGHAYWTGPDRGEPYWDHLAGRIRSGWSSRATRGAVRLLAGAGGGAVIRYEAPGAEDRGMSPLPPDLFSLFSAHRSPETFAGTFIAWFEGGAGGYAVLVGAGAGASEVTPGRVVPLRGRLDYRPADDGITIRRILTDEGGREVGPHRMLGGGLVHLVATRGLGHIGNPEALRPWHALRGDPGVTLREEELIAPRPACSRMAIPDEGGGAMRLLGPAGEAVAPVTLAPEITIRFAPSRESDDVEAEIRMIAGDIELPHPSIAHERILDIEDSRAPDPMLTSSRRQSALRALATRLLLAGKRGERAEIVREVAESPQLRAPAHAELARRMLQDLSARVAGDTSATIHPGTGPASPWVRVEGGIARAGEALGLLRSLEGLRPLETGAGPAFAIPAQGFRRAVGRFAIAAAARGIRAEYEGRPIEIVHATVEVGAIPTGEIDWFELRPEVRCGDFTIPPEHWESIMRGEIQTGPDGRIRVIALDNPEAIARVRELLDRHDAARRRKNEPIRVPRLQMLDWLAMANDGIVCRLPPDEARVLKSLLEFDGIPRAPLPVGLRAAPRDYQQRGYDWLAFLYRHRFGACLADDMGLGKTLQAICLLGALQEGKVRPRAPRRETGPHLIVLPPTLLFNWRSEIESFYPALSVAEHSGARRSADFGDADVVLTTYDLARRDIDALAKIPFHIAIFDEAQAVKNLLGARAQAMRQIRALFRLCLTGTPMENHAGEYYSILDLAVPGIFGEWKEFQKDMREEGRVLERARPFVLRRTKDRILTELPPKVETDAHLDLSEAQRQYYTRAVAEVREEVSAAYRDRPSQQAGIVALAALVRLRQICISPAILDPGHAELSPKLEHLAGKLAELAAEGHAALVFSQFTRALDLVGRALEAGGIGFIRLDGSTPSPKRKRLVAEFQSPSGPGVFLISLKTGGAGLNLTRASYVFHMDPWWNPAVESQASDRAHRMGQRSTVFIHRLIMRHTVEEKMLELKRRKQALFRRIVEGAESRAIGPLITREDFQFLVE
ncbi:MAG: DEAD/DEAH box helicase [Verrucomicrobiae bacterium]|nr:DEAD/DEAH box helicase [Verrucomicrobiae bacterium]